MPLVGKANPRMARIVVDFPDPFGPRKPLTRPGRTTNDRSSTATVLPNRLVRFRTSITCPTVRMATAERILPPQAATTAPAVAARRGSRGAEALHPGHSQAAGRGERGADERLEELEGEGGVVGVERGLVPLVREPLGQRVGRVVPVAVPPGGVLAEVGVVMAALEVLVDEHHPGDLLAHVGGEEGGGDGGVVRLADGLADVVAQGGDHEVVVGAGALGAGGG